MQWNDIAERNRSLLDLAFWFILVGSLIVNAILLSERYNGEPIVKELLPNTLDRCYVVYFPGSQQRVDVACVATEGEGD